MVKDDGTSLLVVIEDGLGWGWMSTLGG